MTNASARSFGFLVLDKPAGLTSHDCVSRVRRAYGLRRVGHGGTLDPAVTGVLPIALGSATRLLPYLEQGKGYRGVLQLGMSTSTDDLEGTVMERRGLTAISAIELSRVLDEFRGQIRQVPPQISAVHINGVRAYRLAREGRTSLLPERSVTIHRLEVENWDPSCGQLTVHVACSAGTYIRTLARDLGARLGCGGCLAALRRTEALGFKDMVALPLSALERDPLPPLHDPIAVLGHWPRRRLKADEVEPWRCGRRIPTSGPEENSEDRGSDGEQQPGPVVILNPAGDLAGMARQEGHWLHPRLVIDARG